MTYTFERTPSILIQDRIVKALIHAEAAGLGPLTSNQIAEHAHGSIRNIRRVLAHMVWLPRSVKRVRISGWDRHKRGEPSALYSVGASPNCPRPKPYTNSEVSRRYRENHPDMYLKALMNKRIKRVKVHRDRLTTGLYGSAP